ncbi:MAG: ABC transporter ATP-binding protein [Marinifilaceae bacterium]|jgi:lipoprotein-releasing system ATP-binding protein|nr:ABC transporter ATP-binding protein [Marinifilaceae bacterium]
MIVTKDIHKSFGELEVLKGIDLHIKKNEIVSIVGSSGAGKTTLLQIIGTLDKASRGSININNIDISNMNEKKISDFRNKHIGFVFQFHHLLPEFNAIENICIPAWISGKSKNEAEKEAYKLLEILNLRERALHRPAELSGGEQQRVAIARALINNPSVILADEPSGNLDSKNRNELHQLFFDLRDELSQTFVIVTHDNNLSKMTDRTLYMEDGKIYKEK